MTLEALERDGAGFRASARQRLDQALSADAGIPRRHARRLLDARRVLLNGRIVAVASRTASAGDRIAIAPARIDGVAVVGSTSSWLAVDKPAGVQSQPGRDEARLAMSELASVWLDRSGTPADVYVVHRLDTGTSGVLLFARDSGTAAALSKAFTERRVRKEYTAVVHGVLSEERFVDAPIGRTGPATHGVSDSGDTAETRIVPLASASLATLVSAVITTGRTHQIRIHAAHAGHPVVGDRKYGRNGALDGRAGRLMLHASLLVHPITGELRAPLPAAMQSFWDDVASPPSRA